MTDPLFAIRQNLGNSPASAQKADPLSAIRAKMSAPSKAAPSGPLQLPKLTHVEGRLQALEMIANQIIATLKPGDQAKLRTDLAGLTKKDWTRAQ